MNKSMLLLCLTVLLFSISEKVQSQSGKAILNGQVSDDQTGEMLIGCNVVEVDANGRFTSGTITDYNGNYSLEVS